MNKKIMNLMVDIETMGKREDCIILSYAIKSFVLPEMKNQTAVSIDFDADISIFSSLLAHRKSEFDTEKWWGSPEASQALDLIKKNQIFASEFEPEMKNLYDLLSSLNNDYNVYLWGRGIASFDLPILSHAMRQVVGSPYREPWEFWKIMDARSIVRFAKWAGLGLAPCEEIPHSAKGDVIREIDEVKQSWDFIRGIDYGNINTVSKMPEEPQREQLLQEQKDRNAS